MNEGIYLQIFITFRVGIKQRGKKFIAFVLKRSSKID